MRESNVGGGEGEGVVRVMRKMFRRGSKARPRLRLPALLRQPMPEEYEAGLAAVIK